MAALAPIWLVFTIAPALLILGLAARYMMPDPGTPLRDTACVALIVTAGTLVYITIWDILASSAYAHDGGFTEYGSSWSGWRHGGGSSEALSRGYGPAGGAGIGNLLAPGPTDKRLRSERPECEALYHQLEDARRSYDEARQDCDRIWQRLERARRIHIANQTKLVLRYGVELGQIAGAGVEGVHGAGRGLRGASAGEPSPATGSDASDAPVTDWGKAARAKGALMAEPLKQLDEKILELTKSLGPQVLEATWAVNRLAQEKKELMAWYEENYKQVGMYRENRVWRMGDRHPINFPQPPDPASPFEMDYGIAIAEIDTNAIAREEIQTQIARQGGVATPAQLAELQTLRQRLDAAIKYVEASVKQAEAWGYKPVEDYLKSQDPNKFQRLLQIDSDIENAQNVLNHAQNSQDMINQLKAQRAEIARGLSEGIPPDIAPPPMADVTTAALPSDSQVATLDPGASAKPVQVRQKVPPGPTADTPTGPSGGSGGGWPSVGATSDDLAPEPGTLEYFRRKGESWAQWMLTPITWPLGLVGRAWAWAFVGQQQTPEQIGKILRQGIDTINHLTKEFDQSQQTLDRLLHEVEKAATGLQNCNKLRQPAGVYR